MDGAPVSGIASVWCFNLLESLLMNSFFGYYCTERRTAPAYAAATFFARISFAGETVSGSVFGRNIR